MLPAAGPQKRILITGGSGFVGINLIRTFLRNGYNRITSFDAAPLDEAEAGQVRTICADIRNRGAVEEAMQHADVVVHAAAATQQQSRRDIVSTNVVGTRIVLEAAHRHGIQRFVHISSTVVYGVPAIVPITEHHERVSGDECGAGAFGAAKIRAEQLCEDLRRRGTCVTILRPQCCVGPERLGGLEFLYSLAADGRAVPLIGTGAHRHQLVDVQDLCDVILLCLTESRDRVNDSFNIGAAVFGTVLEDLEALLDAAGRNRQVVSLPERATIACLRTLDTLRLSSFHQWMCRTATADSYVSVQKAVSRLGFSPMFSNADALRRNFAWYVQHRAVLPPTGPGHRSPWKHGALNLIKAFV